MTGGDHSGVFVPSVDLLPKVISSGRTRAWLDEIHAPGGMAVVNHPFYGNPLLGEALAWDQSLADSLRFDVVEVWNTLWLTRRDVPPNYEPDNYLAVQWWERTFGPARRGPALGASDNHWKLLDGVAGVGQPTAWVYATDRTAAGLIAGVQAGRTSVSWQPPRRAGPRLLLDVVEQWRGRATMTGGWLRAELLLEERLALTALTSCVYADGRVPAKVRQEPTRGQPVTYDGTGFATLPLPAGAACLPACSCAH